MHRRCIAPRNNVFGEGAVARRAWQLSRALAMDRVTKTAPRTSGLDLKISWRSASMHCAAIKSGIFGDARATLRHSRYREEK